MPTGGDGSDIGAYEVQADQLTGCSNINRVVNNNNDSGPDSLRAVIANVCAGSTMTFAPSVTGAINLTSGELLLNKTVTISGPGANLLSVQRSAAGGTPDFRIFNITPNSVIATISGLTIANGNTPSNGGGISNTGGAYHRQLHHLGPYHRQQRRRYSQQSHAKYRQQHHLRQFSYRWFWRRHL